MFTYVISDKIDFQYDQPAYYMLHINENNAMNLQTSRSPSSGLEIPNWGKWLWGKYYTSSYWKAILVQHSVWVILTWILNNSTLKIYTP